MSTVTLKLEHLYKKFARGEQHDSLRDLLPSMARSLVRRTIAVPKLRATEFWALNDVSFTVSQGEALGVIGHNGAGKSTLLKHLSGILRPTSGTIEVRGKLSALIEVGAGFHQDLTGRENVFLNGAILGMTRSEIRAKFDEIVDFSGIREFIDMPVKRYSSGMYARLGFSVAAHLDPDILIIDEVLSVGDYAFQARCVDKMRSIMQRGATIIFVSHNLRAVAELCARAILMDKGRLVADDTADKVIQKYLESNSAREPSTDRPDAVIEYVRVASDTGSRLTFQSGETASVEVKVHALRNITGAAVDLYMLDQQFYPCFNTSTQRLGLRTLDLKAGETRSYRFELDLHLAAGTFYLCAAIFRSDIGHLYDRMEPAATLFMTTPVDVRGIVHLHPRVQELP